MTFLSLYDFADQRNLGKSFFESHLFPLSAIQPFMEFLLCTCSNEITQQTQWRRRRQRRGRRRRSYGGLGGQGVRDRHTDGLGLGRDESKWGWFSQMYARVVESRQCALILAVVGS